MESATVITSICQHCGQDIKRQGGSWYWSFKDDAGTEFHFPFCNEHESATRDLKFHKPSELLVARRILESYERTT
jgi:hypothetical protein